MSFTAPLTTTFAAPTGFVTRALSPYFALHIGLPQTHFPQAVQSSMPAAPQFAQGGFISITDVARHRKLLLVQLNQAKHQHSKGVSRGTIGIADISESGKSRL